MERKITATEILQVQAEAFKRKNFKGITHKGELVHHKMGEALSILTDNTTTEFMYGGGAGSAKTFTGAYWMLMSCLVYPGIRCYVSRKRLNDLVKTTLETFRKVRKSLKLPTNIFKFNGSRNVINFANGSSIHFLASSYEPSDPEYERLGSLEFTLGWLEEAGEIPHQAFHILKTRTGRQLNDKYNLKPKTFITANPTKNWIYREFYREQKNLPPHKKFLQAFVYDNPFIESVYIEQLEGLPEGAKKQRLLYGNWEFDDDPTALLEYEKIMQMFQKPVSKTGDRYLICDAARDGGDKITAFIFDGLQLIHLDYWTKVKTNVSADKINKLCILYGIPPTNVLVDVNGVGGGLADQLPEGTQEFINNAKALNDENYRSLKDQCGYYLAKYINQSLISLANVPMDDDTQQLLIEELEWLKSYQDELDGKARILPKDQIKEAIGRSPDFLDTLLMRMYFEIKNNIAILKVKNQLTNFLNFPVNQYTLTSVSWHISPNNEIATTLFQSDEYNRIFIIGYLEKSHLSLHQFAQLLTDYAKDHNLSLYSHIMSFMRTNILESDNKSDQSNILKSIGFSNIRIMPKLDFGEDRSLLLAYFNSLIFHDPLTAQSFYQINQDNDASSIATQSLLPIIQFSVLRHKFSPINTIQDIRHFQHSPIPKLQRKAHYLARKILNTED